MSCRYEINGTWYSESEAKEIYKQSKEYSDKYYKIVDELSALEDNAENSTKRSELENQLKELDTQFYVPVVKSPTEEVQGNVEQQPAVNTNPEQSGSEQTQSFLGENSGTESDKTFTYDNAGQYAIYKYKEYLVLGVNDNGTIRLMDLDTTVKLAVSPDNITRSSTANAIPVFYEASDYLVLANNSIVSVGTGKVMKWDDKNGNRKAILKAAEEDRSSSYREFEDPTKLAPKQLPILKLERKERDVVKPAQILLPWKFNAKMSKYVKNGKIDMSKIDPKVLQGFGMRIPNHGPNSQVAFEIVGFLPKNSGDDAVMSKDLITQMGWDFDFDTLYTYMYDCVEFEGKLQPITKELKQQILAKFGISENRIGSIVRELRKKGIYGSSIESTIEEYKYKRDTLDDAVTISDEQSKVEDSEDRERFRQLKIKLKREFREFDELYTKLSGDLEKLVVLSSILSKDAELKNEMLDTHISVHSNPSKDVQKQIKKPIGRWVLGDFADFMDKESSRTKSKVSQLSDEYQTEKFLSGRSGKDGIALFSLFNTFLSVMNQSKSTAEEDKIKYKNWKKVVKNGIVTYELVDWYVTIGNQVFTGDLGKSTANNRELKTSIAEGVQSVSVDNANDVIMDKINLNTDTFKFVVGAISLGITSKEKGREKEIIPLMMNQPIILDYVKAIRESTKMREDPKGIEKRAFGKVFKEYEKRLGYDLTSEGTDYSKKIFLQNKGNLLTLENLENSITGKEPIENPDLMQLVALTIFKEIENVGASVQAIMTSVNTDSAMLGKNLLETSAKESVLETNLLKTSIVNIDKVIGKFSGNIADFAPDTINGYATKYGLLFNNRLWESIAPYSDPSVKMLFDKAAEAFSNTDTSVTGVSKFRNTIWSNLKSFIFTNPSLSNIDTNTTAEKIRLFVDDKVTGKTSLATYVGALKESTDRYAFINVLTPEIGESNTDPSKLTTTDANLESSDMNALYASFVDMFVTDRALPNFNGEPYSTRKLAQDLAISALLAGGVNDAKNFIRLIPPVYLYNIKGSEDSQNYLDKLSKYVQNPNFGGLFSEVDMNAVIEQIAQNNPQLLPNVTPKAFSWIAKGAYKIREEYDKGQKLVTKGAFPNLEILVRMDNGVYVNLLNRSRKNFRDYSFNRQAVGAPTSHIVKPVSPNNIEIEQKEVKKEVELLGLSNGGNEVINKTLNIIETTSGSTYHKSLAKLFKEILKGTKISVTTGSIIGNSNKPVKGSYNKTTDGYTVKINTDPKDYPNGIDTLDLETTVLHELSHVAANGAYNKAQNLIKSGKASLTVTTSVMAIDSLFERYKNKIEDLRKSGIDVKVTENATKNIYEFMSEVMTDPDVQSLINTMEYSSHQTFFDRFVELINRLVSSLGFDMNTTTALAMKDILTLYTEAEHDMTDKENPNNGNTSDRSFEKYFPSVTDVATKYGTFTKGIKTEYSRESAMQKAETINKEQGVYRATPYQQANGTYSVELVRDSRMDNPSYAYDNLNNEGKEKLRKDIC